MAVLMRAESLSIVGTGATAFLAALVATLWARRAAVRYGILDHPNARSSHGQPTPRTGGLAILAAMIASLALSGGALLARPAYGAFFLALAGVAAIGFRDDQGGLSPFTRLGIQTLLAAGFVAVAGGLDTLPLPPPLNVPLGWLGPPLAVIWIVTVINFYNFIDGIDGLAGLQAVVTGVGMVVLGFDPLASLVAASIAGASLGFLFHNWSPARIFLGDAGSGLLGFAFAALPLLAPPEWRSTTVLFAGVSLWFFLADALWTLVRRVLGGHRWYEAHREHLYQRLVASGLGHASVAAGLGVASALVTTVALSIADGLGIALVLGAALFGAEIALVSWRMRGRGLRTSAKT